MNGGTFISFFDKEQRKFKVENKIRKEIRKCYDSSKYKGYPIILKGFLVIDKKNRTNLILYDIFLKDEYDGILHLKRYGIRYENLTIRFLNQNVEYVKPIFSHEFSDFNLDIFIKLFVKTLSTDKVVFRKNTLINLDEDDFFIEDIWTDFIGEIVGAIPGESIKREFDEKQNITSETPFEYLKSFNIKIDDKIVEVELFNFSEADKVEMLSKSAEFIGRKCRFRKYKILNNEGYVFIDCI